MSRSGQPAALDCGDVLAHRVHGRDRRAGRQKRLVDGNLIGERKGTCGGGQQCRSAAADERDHQIIRAEPAHALHETLCAGKAGLIRHRVRRLQNLDHAGRRAIAVAGDDHAFQRPVPGIFQRRRHLGRSLAGPDHNCAAPGLFRQECANGFGRVGGGDGSVEQSCEKRLRIDAAGHMRPQNL